MTDTPPPDPEARYRYVVTEADGVMADKTPPGTVLIDGLKDPGDRWAQWDLFNSEVGEITGTAVGYRIAEWVDGLPRTAETFTRWGDETAQAAATLDGPEAEIVTAAAALYYQQAANPPTEDPTV